MRIEAVQMSGWMRAWSIIVGIIAIVLSIMVLFFPLFALETLILFLAIALLFIGIDRLISGIAGKMYRPAGYEREKRVPA